MATNATRLGKFVWFEYVTKDIRAAQGFFGELFNWQTKEVPMAQGTYAMIVNNGRSIGGYQPTPVGTAADSRWLSHLEIDDLKTAVATVGEAGGKVVVGPMPVGDFGTMAIVNLPRGAEFALWQPAKAEDEPVTGPGTFVWNELLTDDPEAAVALFRKLVGYQEERMDLPGDMGAYHVLVRDGQRCAGIMKKASPDRPNAWLPYVHVDDADIAAEKAARLGGTVQVPPDDIPNVGRFAILGDPQGAPLAVIKPFGPL